MSYEFVSCRCSSFCFSGVLSQGVVLYCSALGFPLTCMNRRESVRGIGVAAATALLSSCHKNITAKIPGQNCLPPVKVSADREIRTVCGLRPYRPSGFVVKAEKLDETLVVHNYGHGGAGITLSWGTSKLAVELGAQGFRGAAAVIGCGVLGLSTARLLQHAGFQVTIYAKDLPPNTTSNIAGGWWSPVMVVDHDRHTPAFDEQFASATKFAYERFQLMTGWRYGVRWTRSYVLNNVGFDENGLNGKNGALRAMLPEMRDLNDTESPFRGFKYVRQFDAMLIEPPIYLTAMMEDFRIAGGKIVVRAFSDSAELAKLPEKLVFNCTGLGAKDLFKDEELTPIKGQLTFLLPQPEVEYSTISEGGLYMFSRRDGILLGGTHDRGNWSLDVDEAVKAKIITGHQKLFQGMRAC
jgi:D-amino-acid oxidase